ncbi:unnamed protein product, partial [Mesorhabditis belari]|uniref:Uncharacterized protein n=1 Tax=Mesorhabditis belari TaxID=2138241 RepID=A0AAF3E9P3_9BILA
MFAIRQIGPANARRASFFPNTENGIGDELATLLHKTETIAGRRNSAVSSRKGSDEPPIPVSGRRFSVIDRIREKREKEEREQKELEKQSKEGLKVKTIAEDEKESTISSNFSPRSSDLQQNATQEIDSASRALVCRNEQVCSPVACETPHSDISVDSTYGSQSGRQLSPLTPEEKGNAWTSNDSIPIGDLPSLSSTNKLASNESDVLQKTQGSSAKSPLKDQNKKPTTNGLDLCGIRVEEIDENKKPKIAQPTRKMLTRTITQTTFTKPAPKRSDSTVKNDPSNTATTTTTTTFPPKRVMPGVIRRADSSGSERGKTLSQPSKAPSTTSTSTSRASIRTVPITTLTEKKPPSPLKILPKTPSTTSSTPATPATPANKPSRLPRGATSSALLMSTKSQQSLPPIKPPPQRRVTAPVAPILYNRQVSTSARPSLVQTGVVQPKTANIVTTTIEKPRLLRATVVNKKPISSDVTEKPRMARTLRSTASADLVSSGTKLPSSPLTISRTPMPPKVSTKVSGL